MVTTIIMATSIGKVGRFSPSSSASEESIDDDIDVDAIAEGQYVVEKIIDKKTGPGGPFYLLKWKGYPDSDNSWEPPSNIHCPDLIKEFEDEMLKKEEKKRKIEKKKKEQKKARTNELKIKVKVEKVSSSSSKKTKVNDDTGAGDPGEEKTPLKVVDENKNKICTAVDRVIGATKLSGDEVYYIMKWKDSDEVKLLTYEQCWEKCPLTLINFFEEKLTWNNKNMEIKINLLEFDSSSASD